MREKVFTFYMNFMQVLNVAEKICGISTKLLITKNKYEKSGQVRSFDVKELKFQNIRLLILSR